MALTADRFLSLVHVASAASWIACGVLGQGIRFARGRPPDTSAVHLETRGSFLLVFEHASLALALGAGILLLYQKGWGLGHARWLAVKVGLVAFLVLPLEAMHAYVSHVWIAGRRSGTSESLLTRNLQRGVGMEDMIRTLSVPLLGLSVPLLVWLSVAKPF